MLGWRTLSIAIGCTAAALFALAPLPATAQVSFAAPANYSLAQGASAFAVGDLNADAKPDVVAIQKYPNKIAVFLNQGNGALSAGVVIALPAGAYPAGAAIGDVNGDGKADVVVPCNGSACIAVFFGDGRGGLETGPTYPTGAGPNGVALLDLNGDGKLDAATPNLSGSSISVFLNTTRAAGDKTGIFGAAAGYATGTSPYSITTGDIDGDGRADLAVSSQGTSSVDVFLSDGKGGLQQRIDVAAGYAPNDVAIADFNGDHVADLASCDYSYSNVNVSFGALVAGKPSFSAPAATSVVGKSPVAMARGDLNGSGRQALVTVNYATQNASILIPNPDGSFQTPVLIGPGLAHSAVSVADLNADGLDDLILANSNSTFSVYVNTTTGIAGLSLAAPRDAADPTLADVEVGHFVIGTVTLTAAAPSGGLNLVLASSADATAFLPGGTVIIPAGQRTATFVVAAQSPGTATIAATLNGITTVAGVKVIAETTGSTLPTNPTVADVVKMLKKVGSVPAS